MAIEEGSMMNPFEKELQGYCLTTAEITYHLPDYPELLQAYVWQEYDLPPKYPELESFLGFWEESIEAQLHSVQVASMSPLKPTKLLVPKVFLTLQ